MKQDNPLLQAAVISAVVVVFFLWLTDLRQERAGTRNPRAFPGAHPAAGRAVVLAVLGALVILAVETAGEIQLGLVAEQSTMTALAAVFTLAMAFLEELVFRGYFVVRGRGRGPFLFAVFGFSLLFAALHPFLWTWEGGLDLAFTPTLKGWYSSGMIFLGSLWFYFVRFQPANPSRSLVPCIAAHGAMNLGVVAIKAGQGYLVGWV